MGALRPARHPLLGGQNGRGQLRSTPVARIYTARAPCACASICLVAASCNTQRAQATRPSSATHLVLPFRHVLGHLSARLPQAAKIKATRPSNKTHVVLPFHHELGHRLPAILIEPVWQQNQGHVFNYQLDFCYAALTAREANPNRAACMSRAREQGRGCRKDSATCSPPPPGSSTAQGTGKRTAHWQRTGSKHAHMKPAAAWCDSGPPPRRARKSISQASKTMVFSTWICGARPRLNKLAPEILLGIDIPPPACPVGWTPMP